ncbi:MAG: DUF1549 and DUF1553 domain-containing protein [Planctomycetota bacterium]
MLFHTETLMASRFFALITFAVTASYASLSLARDGEVSFVHDVMPVLSRAGCDGGGCHGHRDGKGDLNLSLWGESPATDHKALTSRRKLVNLKQPLRSLILRKPTLQNEHEGQKRFAVDSKEFDVLRRWIESGAKNDSATAPRLESLRVTPSAEILSAPSRERSLKVEALFSNGERRDVTYWAVYSLSNFVAQVSSEGVVRFQKPGETTVTIRYLDRRVSARLAFIPERRGFSWSDPKEENYVDEHVFRKLKRFRLATADVCDDSTFVRRAFLDILGSLPSEAEARAFVADTTTDKRAKLIDRLLARPEYADFWALKWSDLLRNEEKVLDRKGVGVFHAWIRESLREGKGLHTFARELLTSRGSTYENPPANYYRALRNPVDRAEATAQVFLGARLRCAKCHNHPFDRWTQDEYYEFAALFDGIKYEIVENKRRDKLDKNQFIGEQRVQLVKDRKFKDPRDKSSPTPRLLGRETPPLDAKRDRFEQLADWITSPKNELFARVQANRIWFHLMGRGLVEPVDDFRATNPPTHPELLDALARDLAANDFDVRHLVRRIVTSRTYQLSSEPSDSSAQGLENYASASMPRLSAEVLLDSVHAALAVAPDFKRYKGVRRATSLPGIEGAWLDKKPYHDDRFLRLFGKPPRILNSDAERLNETSLAQVFELTSGNTLSSLLETTGNRLDRLLASERDDSELLDSLYWTTVTRAPTEKERAIMLPLLEATKTRDAKRVVLQDITWALANSKEFMFRH